MLIKLSPQLHKEGPIYPGHSVTLYIDLKDINDNATNDPGLELWVQDEGHGSVRIHNSELSNPSTGRYEYDWIPQSCGVTRGRWRSSNVTRVNRVFEMHVQNDPVSEQAITDIDTGVVGLAELGSNPQ